MVLLARYSFAQPSPGLSLRQPAVDILAYTFRIQLGTDVPAITGLADIRLRLTAALQDTISLDLVDQGLDGLGIQVQRVLWNQQETAFRHQHDMLKIPRSGASGDTVLLRIAYQGQPKDGLIITYNRYGELTYFGDNWPNRARHWLPVMDHPADKALVRWEVEAAARYRVMANGRFLTRKALPHQRARTVYQSEHPIPTKLMVIGVAPFVTQPLGTEKDIEVSGWVYPQGKKSSLRALAPSVSILRWMAEMIGPFPYAKLAHVQSTTRYGGMENAGAIFYDEKAFTTGAKLETLIAHETAHQWFGDAITEASWPHVWLSEGFADYFAQLYREAHYGPDSIRAGMDAARRAVILMGPDAPLVDSVYLDPIELLNVNSYDKGAWVLHMLRDRIGDEAFWPGIRAYYKRYAHKNASTADFQHVMEELSGEDLEDFFHTWVYGKGHPVLRGQWTYEKQSGKVNIFLMQGGKKVFQVPLEVMAWNEKGQRIGLQRFQLKEKSERLIMRLRERPVRIQLDPRVRLLFNNQFEELH